MAFSTMHRPDIGSNLTISTGGLYGREECDNRNNGRQTMAKKQPAFVGNTEPPYKRPSADDIHWSVSITSLKKRTALDSHLTATGAAASLTSFLAFSHHFNLPNVGSVEYEKSTLITQSLGVRRFDEILW